MTTATAVVRPCGPKSDVFQHRLRKMKWEEVELGKQTLNPSLDIISLGDTAVTASNRGALVECWAGHKNPDYGPPSERGFKCAGCKAGE